MLAKGPQTAIKNQNPQKSRARHRSITGSRVATREPVAFVCENSQHFQSSPTSAPRPPHTVSEPNTPYIQKSTCLQASLPHVAFFLFPMLEIKLSVLLIICFYFCCDDGLLFGSSQRVCAMQKELMKTHVVHKLAIPTRIS